MDANQIKIANTKPSIQPDTQGQVPPRAPHRSAGVQRQPAHRHTQTDLIDTDTASGVDAKADQDTQRHTHLQIL